MLTSRFRSDFESKYSENWLCKNLLVAKSGVEQQVIISRKIVDFVLKVLSRMFDSSKVLWNFILRGIIALVIAYSKDVYMAGERTIRDHIDARLASRVYFHCVWDGLFKNLNTNFAPAIIDYADQFRSSGNLLSLLSLVYIWLMIVFRLRRNLGKFTESHLHNLLRFLSFRDIHYLHVTKTKIFYKFYLKFIFFAFS